MAIKKSILTILRLIRFLTLYKHSRGLGLVAMAFLCFGSYGFAYDGVVTSEERRIVKECADQYNIPHAVAFSLIWQESRFDNTVCSHAGACGLAQLMPGTARHVGANRSDPRSNVCGGMKYLSWQFRKYQDWSKALAAYNAGPGTVDKYGLNLPCSDPTTNRGYCETVNYVDAINNYTQQLKEQEAQGRDWQTYDLPGMTPHTKGSGPVANGAATPEEKEVDLGFNTVMAHLLPDALIWFNHSYYVLAGLSDNGRIDDPTLPDLFKIVRDAAMILLFSLFVFSLFQTVYFERNGDYLALFMRLGAAALIIMGSSSISNTLSVVWQEAYSQANAAYVNSTNDQMLESVKAIGISMAPAVVGIFAAEVAQQVLGKSASIVKLNLSLSEVTKGVGNLAFKTVKFAMALLIIILLMFAVYGLVVYTSALSTLLLMLLLPLIAVMLLRPEMTKFMLRTLSIYATALVVAVIGPIVFTIILDLAFVAPLQQLASSTTEARDLVLGDPGSFFNGSSGAITYLGALGNVATQWGLALILTVVGTFIGFLLMLSFERIVASMLGGVASSGGTAFMAMGLGAAAWSQKDWKFNNKSAASMEAESSALTVHKSSRQQHQRRTQEYARGDSSALTRTGPQGETFSPQASASSEGVPNALPNSANAGPVFDGEARPFDPDGFDGTTIDIDAETVEEGVEFVEENPEVLEVLL